MGVTSSICFVAAFAIGINWGPIGIASAYAVASYVILMPSLRYRLKHSPITIPMFFRAMLLPTIASLIMGFIIVLLSPWIMSYGRVPEIILSMIVGCVTYVIVWMILPGGRHLLVEYFSYIRMLFKVESCGNRKGL